MMSRDTEILHKLEILNSIRLALVELHNRKGELPKGVADFTELVMQYGAYYEIRRDEIDSMMNELLPISELLKEISEE